MEPTDAIYRPTAPPSPGSFAPVAFLATLVVAPVVGLVWAWAAETAQFYVAPFLLFPIVVGVLAGLTVVGLARFAQVGHRPTVVLAALLAAAVAACGQHYLHYLSTYSRALPVSPFVAMDEDEPPDINELIDREEAAQNLSAIQKETTPSFAKYLAAQARRGRPLPGGYVATGWQAWLTWGIDVLLTLAAAVAVTLPGIGIPYCNRCRTWYRTIRNGKIDVPTAHTLAKICDVDEIRDLHSPRYRLSCCQGGCGPTRCELSWEESNGFVDLVRVWLDGEQRSQIVAVLDGLANEVGEERVPLNPEP